MCYDCGILEEKIDELELKVESLEYENKQYQEIIHSDNVKWLSNFYEYKSLEYPIFLISCVCIGLIIGYFFINDQIIYGIISIIVFICIIAMHFVGMKHIKFLR